MTSPFRDEKEAALARVEQLERENADLRARLGAQPPLPPRPAAPPPVGRATLARSAVAAVVASTILVGWTLLDRRAATQPGRVLVPAPDLPAEARTEAPTGQWSALTASTRRLRAAMTFDKTAYFVGDRGALVRFGDASAPDETVLGAGDVTLLGVGGAPGHVFAVGANGVIFAQRARDGKPAWTLVVAHTDAALRAVAWADGEAWAVGQRGTVVHRRDDEDWDPLGGTIADADFNGVAFGNGAMYVVGSHGAIWRRANGMWQEEPSGVDADLFAVAAHDGALYAVGASGTILRRARDGWVREASGTMRDLRAVASDGARLYAVGDGGTILSSGTRGTWVAEASHSSATLTAVAAAQTDGTRYVYAAGEGALLRRAPM